MLKLFRYNKILKTEKIIKPIRRNIIEGKKGPRKVKPIRVKARAFFINAQLNDSLLSLFYIEFYLN